MNKYRVHYDGIKVRIIEADCYSVSAEGSTHFYHIASDKTKTLVASVLSAAQPLMIMKQDPETEGTGGRGWVPWTSQEWREDLGGPPEKEHSSVPGDFVRAHLIEDMRSFGMDEADAVAAAEFLLRMSVVHVGKRLLGTFWYQRWTSASG